MVGIDNSEITAHQSECQLPLGDVLQLLDELVISRNDFVTKTAPRTLGDFTLWISLLQRPKTKTRSRAGPTRPEPGRHLAARTFEHFCNNGVVVSESSGSIKPVLLSSNMIK